MHASCASMFACLLLIAACMHATNAELVMVYSLQRHGARNVLPKGALLTETDLIGGPTLLPEGQRQTYNAGAARGLMEARYGVGAASVLGARARTAQLVVLPHKSSSQQCRPTSRSRPLHQNRTFPPPSSPRAEPPTPATLPPPPAVIPHPHAHMQNTGAAFRARYLSNTTCSATGTCLNGSDASGGVSSGGKYGVVGQPGVGFGECV